MTLSKYLLLHLILCLASASAQAQLSKQNLKADWKLRNIKEDSWIDAIVPATVQYNLCINKKMQYPYFGNNVSSANWVAEQAWEYAAYFNIKDEVFKHKIIELNLKGLDTYCEVKLNGVVIGNCNNAFTEWRFNIKAIATREQNYLTIQFFNTQHIADSIALKSNIKLPTDARAYVRKPAYHFGWDIAPKMMTVGIVGDMEILGYESIEKDIPKPISVAPFLTFDNMKFQFLENGKPIFIKGANIVPPTTFEPITNKKIDTLLKNAQDLSINMLRVWGGGVYMPEYFYTQCDKLHINIWQDFMVANCMLPPDAVANANLYAEIKNTITNLMHHPCIVLWCGNNEIDEAWQNWGWRKQYNYDDSLKLYTNYQKIFTQDIPFFVRNIDRNRPYISTSPRYGWGDKLSMTNADAHYWGVWWGLQPIENYYKCVPRFMSEYGMQALPDIHSILNFCDKKNLLMTDSAFTSHQLCDNGFAKISEYLKMYPAHFDNMGYIYNTNLIQRDAIVTAVSAHRAAFPYCNGSMVWQLNDCWPGITWSMIDFYNRPKAGYYALRNCYANNYLGLAKQLYEGDKQILDTNKYEYALVLNEPNAEINNAITTFTVYDFYGEVQFKSDKINWIKNAVGNYYTFNFFDKTSFNGFNWSQYYLVVDIVKNNQKILSKEFLFAAPKQLKLLPANITATWVDSNVVNLSTDVMAKDVYIYSTSSATNISNNYFNLLPNNTVTIKVDNFKKGRDSLKIFSALDFSAE
jgi:beta-mannosidase